VSQGVLAAYEGRSWTSLAIEWRTWRPFSHISYISAHGRTIEAWHPRVRVLEDYSEGHQPGTIIRCFSVDWSVDQEASVVKHLLTQVGIPYDTRGALGFVSRRNRAQNRTKWFCSELISWAARQVPGAELLAREPDWRIAPGDLVMSTRLTYVGYLVVGKPDALSDAWTIHDSARLNEVLKPRPFQDALQAVGEETRPMTRLSGRSPVCSGKERECSASPFSTPTPKEAPSP
jgi:hypothetical protein